MLSSTLGFVSFNELTSGFGREDGGKRYARQELNHTSVSPKYLCGNELCLHWEIKTDRSFQWVSSKFFTTFTSQLPSDSLQGWSCHFLSPVTYWRCVWGHIFMHVCSRVNVLEGALACASVTALPQILPKWKNILANSFLAVSDVTIFTLQLFYLPLSSPACSSSVLPGFAGPRTLNCGSAATGSRVCCFCLSAC